MEVQEILSSVINDPTFQNELMAEEAAINQLIHNEPTGPQLTEEQLYIYEQYLETADGHTAWFNEAWVLQSENDAMLGKKEGLFRMKN
jgi:hypothetical protein